MIGIIGACCWWVVIGCECGIMLVSHAKGGLIRVAVLLLFIMLCFSVNSCSKLIIFERALIGHIAVAYWWYKWDVWWLLSVALVLNRNDTFWIWRYSSNLVYLITWQKVSFYLGLWRAYSLENKNNNSDSVSWSCSMFNTYWVNWVYCWDCITGQNEVARNLLTGYRRSWLYNPVLTSENHGTRL